MGAQVCEFMNLFWGFGFTQVLLRFHSPPAGVITRTAKAGTQTARETTNFDICAVPAVEECADPCAGSWLGAHGHTHNTQQLPGAACSGHSHSPPCHVCPHQLVLVGSDTKGVSWAVVPCAHTGVPELRLGVSGAEMVVPQQQTGDPRGRGSSHLSPSAPEPQSCRISLGTQGTCRGSKLCSFPGALLGSAAGPEERPQGLYQQPQLLRGIPQPD